MKPSSRSYRVAAAYASRKGRVQYRIYLVSIPSGTKVASAEQFIMPDEPCLRPSCDMYSRRIVVRDRP